ncbi:MAG: hypothetical protein MUO17_05220 [Dehalococcoidales bacterium]|jgi:hypothetical protein|nr:hypothetical protein [Dehalococcoidales bacterium]
MAESKYSRLLVTKPVYEAGVPVKGRQSPSMTLMSNALVPGCNMYLEVGWIWEMPTPNPHIHEHSHSFDEIVLHLGGDPNNPEELGGEIEYCVEGQPLVFNKSSAIYLPKGTKHGPLTWKKFAKPHLEMAIMIGTGSYKEGWPTGVGEKK